MTETIVFPDVEALFVAALPDVLGVAVSTRVPNPRPASFIRVKRAGGGRRNLVTDAALVVVEAWADTEPAAADLAMRASAALFALAQTDTGGVWIRRVQEISGPSSFTDPVSGSPRYQLTAQIDTRGAPIQ